MKQLQERFARGEVVILDGATGTELEKRGVPMDGLTWSVTALETHTDTVRELHEDYIRAGADIIITNTFLARRDVLEPAGIAEQCWMLNQRAVALAEQARKNVADRPVYIAGSISTTTALKGQAPTGAQALAIYQEQANALAEAGADFLMLELLRDIEQATYAVRAAADTGLPIWLAFSCVSDEDGTVWLRDRTHTLADGMEALLPIGGSVISIMHTQVEDTAPALHEVKRHWSGPVGAYSHSGQFVKPNWHFIDIISPEDYATAAQEWIEIGAQVVGGCCGIGPDHIRLLKERLSSTIDGSLD